MHYFVNCDRDVLNLSVFLTFSVYLDLQRVHLFRVVIFEKFRILLFFKLKVLTNQTRPYFEPLRTIFETRLTKAVSIQTLLIDFR